MLLTTKLYMPQIQTKLVPRPHLMAQFQAGLAGKLTLVSAPAGFGKTTLVSTWLTQQAALVGWLSLDEHDNDPQRFFRYVVAALQTIDDELGESLSALLQLPQVPSAAVLMTTLINELSTIKRDFFLVLDDYHLLQTPAIHEALAFLLENLPPQMHLVLMTRADPPLPLARMRARRQVLEIRAADLRFTQAETATLLTDATGLTLAADELTQLTTRTEGWIAGLHMACLSLQHHAEPTRFIANFAGDNRYIFDYLSDEVLSQQPPEIHEFLLKSAFVDRFCAPLCNALTEQENGEQVLAQLDAANMFIVPLDTRRHWYRYHHLFGDLLRKSLQQTAPELVADLHLRASLWFDENDLIPDAVHHALAAEEFARAAALAASISQSMIINGQLQTLLHWIAAMPDDAVGMQPRLALSHAWALLFTGQVDALQQRLPTLDKLRHSPGVHDGSEQTLSVRQEQEAAIIGEIATIRASLGRVHGDVPTMISFAHQALSMLPSGSLLLRGVAALILSHAHRLNGNLAEAQSAYQDAQIASQQTHNLLSTLVAMGHLIQLDVMAGQLHEADQQYQQTIDFAETNGAHHLPSLGIANIARGELLRLENRLDEAATHLEEGIKLCQQWGALAENCITGYITLAYTRWARGESGLADLQQAAETNRSVYDTQWSHLIDAHRARYCLLAGDAANAAVVDWAQSVAQPPRQPDDVPSSLLSFVEALTFARWLIAQGETDQAIERLNGLNQRTEATGHKLYQLESLLLLALAYHSQDGTQALAYLHQAIGMAAAQGNMRALLDEGEPIHELLRAAAAQGAAPQSAFVHQLLADLRAPQASTPQQPLIEPLSERELEILGLIAAGLSNQAIADTLIIAHSTVKTHINNIYGKLEVPNRTSAVAKARELNLI